MSWKSSITFRLNLYLLIGAAVIYFLAIFYNFRVSRNIMLQKTISNIEQKVKVAVSNVEEVINPVKNIAGSFTGILPLLNYSEEGIQALQRTVININPNIFGCSVLLEPLYDTGDSVVRTYFAHKTNGDSVIQYVSNHNYFDSIPSVFDNIKEEKIAAWTEPWSDKTLDNEAIVSYSIPLFDTAKTAPRFIGMIMVDLKVEWLKELMGKIKILDNGYGILLDSESNIIAAPEKHISSFSKDELITIQMKQINDILINDNPIFLPGKRIDGKNAAYILSMKSTPWFVGVIFPVKEAFTDIRKLFYVILTAGIVGFIFFWLLLVFISRRVFRPLTNLSKATRLIYKGNYNTDLPEVKNVSDEVAQLTRSFEAMQERMSRQIKNYRLTLEEKRNLEHELKIASHIQANMIPSDNPPFPEHKEFELHSTIYPAKGVAGDFYDYYFINPGRLFFMIGDVSGKGVPAALFMVKAVTLLKREALTRATLDEVLFNVNNLLFRNNEASMFVTAICGILDIDTGKVILADAGHTHPLFGLNSNFEFSPLKKNVPLGIKENVRFAQKEYMLKKDHTLILYTDGVTEAANTKGEFYGPERLKKLLQNKNHLTLKEISNIIRISLEDFMYGLKQTDDTTVLIIRYYGKNADKKNIHNK